MRACHVCSGELARDARFCPSCGAATGTPAASPALSHLETREGTPAARPERTPSDVFHGRFLPGTVLDGRYRIVACWARAAWERSTGRTTSSSVSRSR